MMILSTLLEKLDKACNTALATGTLLITKKELMNADQKKDKAM